MSTTLKAVLTTGMMWTTNHWRFCVHSSQSVSCSPRNYVIFPLWLLKPKYQSPSFKDRSSHPSLFMQLWFQYLSMMYISKRLEVISGAYYKQTAQRASLCTWISAARRGHPAVCPKWKATQYSHFPAPLLPSRKIPMFWKSEGCSFAPQLSTELIYLGEPIKTAFWSFSFLHCPKKKPVFFWTSKD